MLTAYDYSVAKIIDSSGVDCILVGDSLGMVMLGYDNTLSVTMEDMIHHTKAVARGTKDALVLADMTFMSYQQSVYDAVVNAGRLVKEGNAQAVKLEGGAEFCPQIEAIVISSIPTRLLNLLRAQHKEEVLAVNPRRLRVILSSKYLVFYISSLSSYFSDSQSL